MMVEGYLRINSRGIIRFAKSPRNLDWNEISVKIQLSIPNKLFERPLIEARVKISEDIIPKSQPVEIILNTKELIEESTGAKIDFKIIPPEKVDEE